MKQYKHLLAMKLRSFLDKNVIEMSIHEEGEFISNIFTRPMKNGGLGLILNLSDLNINLQYHHFKMDDNM